MDAPTQAIVKYVASLNYHSLTEAQRESTVRHILDAMSCALGGFPSGPATVARKVAATATSSNGSSVIGLREKTTPEYATFANTVMVRYLDYNDNGPAGHASDMIAAAIAVGESVGASGQDVILAVFAMYEVVAAIQRSGASIIDLRLKGIDQIWANVGAAIGAGMILGLSSEQLANAISLSVVPAVPLRVTRTGVMSNWKGCATAHGTMNGVFAAHLAAAGMSGPDEPFDGVDGFRSLAGIGPGALEDIGRPVDGLSAIEGTAYKYYPTEYNSQGPLSKVFQIAKNVDIEDIDQINVAIHHLGWHEIGGGQGDITDKWDPTTRETADHSLPYLIAVGLTDGAITVDSFSPERVSDPSLRPFMQKISVTHDPELTQSVKEQGGYEISDWPSIVTFRLKDGTEITERSSWPKGNFHNPMSDDELVEKFRTMSDRIMEHDQAEEFIGTLWRLDELDDINELTALFRGVGR
ncbi:MAG: MmgE/PrpD family protein [Acidimicrobiales bacterium]